MTEQKFKHLLAIPPLVVILVTALVVMPANAIPVLGNSGNWGLNYYEAYIDDAVDWTTADAFATAQTFNGVSGHLATITSAPEDTFLFNLTQATPGVNTSGGFLDSEFWVGGFQAAGAPEPGGGWSWVNGEGSIDPTNAGPGYANWLNGEPNNAGGGENHLAIDLASQFGWNDEGNLGGIIGFVVEYDNAVAVPEPATFLLLGFGLIGLAGAGRKMKK